MARKVKIDFTNVEAFQRASEGVHHVKISDIQEKNTQGGDPMLQVAFEILSGDDKGVKVFDNLVLTDKALWKFKSLLQIIGMKCDGKVAVDLDNMIGKTLNINVTHEEYNGQIRARVSDYLKPGAAKSDDDDEDEDSFDEEGVSEDEEEVAGVGGNVAGDGVVLPVGRLERADGWGAVEPVLAVADWVGGAEVEALAERLALAMALDLGADGDDGVPE